MADSKQFPPTTCPECLGSGREKMLDNEDACSICKGVGMVSHFVAAAYFAEHPDAARADTERDMQAVRPEESEDDRPTRPN